MHHRPLRVAITAVNLGLVALCAAALWPSATPAVQAPPPEAPPVARSEPLPWAPPAWFPASGSADLWALQDLDGEPVHARAPKVRSPAAIVADLDRGEVLWARDPDTPRAVASLTKMVSSLAMASLDPDLDREHCLTEEQWPSRSGARSKFHTGSCHTGWEYLGAALVASDNRGAYALSAVADVEFDQFVDRMNDVSRDLAMGGSRWAEPSGLEDENMASARDMLKAAVAVAAHPDLSVAASAPRWHIDGEAPRDLGTTNRLAHRWETLAAKTGYTDTAHYCFSTVVRTQSGRRIAVAVLGAPTASSRFSDAANLIKWADGLP